MKIKVKYHTDIEPLKIINGGDWIDLRVAEDVFIPKNEFKLVSLGISIQLPENHEAHVVPRSSTFKNFGIIQTNHCGIIDNSYSGDQDIWRFPAYCLKPKDEYISPETGEVIPGTWLHKNDRVCQMRIMEKMPKLEIETVEMLNNPNRGGFGSTGKN